MKCLELARNLSMSKFAGKYIIPIFRTRLNFSSEKISSTEMGVMEVFDNICTLGTFPTAGATWSINKTKKKTLSIYKQEEKLTGRKYKSKKKKKSDRNNKKTYKEEEMAYPKQKQQLAFCRPS